MDDGGRSGDFHRLLPVWKREVLDPTFGTGVSEPGSPDYQAVSASESDQATPGPPV